MERTEDHAVVLRADAYGEADRIVTLFCERGGKLRAIARRARCSQRRFAGLQPCVYGAVGIERRPSQSLHVLADFSVEEGQLGVLLDLGRLTHAAYFCELTDLLTPPEASEPSLYRLLVAVLGELATAPASLERLRRFEARTLQILGFLPSIDECVQCSKKIDAAAGWNETGLLCEDCVPESTPLPLPLRSLWALFAEGPRGPLAGAGHLRAMLATWLRGPLGGRSLRTVEFIEEINR